MNRIHRLRWNRALARWVVTSELARRMTRGRSAVGHRAMRPHALILAGLSFLLVTTDVAWAGAPSGGQVTAGSGQISQSGNTTTIHQSSQTLSLNWQSFDVGAQETVNFLQPNASSIAINRILSATGSEILGHLNANGQVWLLNPNGVLFGNTAQVNVGGLVASTLDLVGGSTDTRHFRGDGNGSVVNQGNIAAAEGGYVALMGHQVSNQGVISAQLGTVALGAGRAQTLTFSGNRLLRLQVDESALNDLVENRRLIEANGGQVFMTAGARDSLLASVVNNTGVVQAQTVGNHNGTITLLGGAQAGTVNVGGTLDASAPRGGDGGTIETSGAQVHIDGAAKVDAAAPAGHSGTWLVDPVDLTIDLAAATAIGNSLNGGTSVTEQTTAGGASGAGQQTSGLGDINVNAAINWTNAAASLTLSAYHGINVNAAVSGAGQIVMNAAGGNLTLSAGGSVTGQAGVTLSTGANFVNNAGASAVSAGSGTRWLIYSTNPTLGTTGGLTPGFIQYNAAYGTTPAQASGNAFLYSFAPTLTVTALTGTVSKTYDGTTAAPLARSNLTVTGLVNGDVITSANGSYGSSDAASSINVTSPTVASAVTVNNGGSIPVYGYALAPSTVTAAIGTISPAPLSAAIVSNPSNPGIPTKVYDGTTTATLVSANYQLTGFVGSQGADVSQPSSVAYDSPDAGSRTINATLASTNFTAHAGTNLANYVLPTAATGAGTITQAPVDLTGLLANSKTYDGTTNGSLNISHAGIFGVIAPDAGSVSLSTAGAAGTFASANAGNNITVAAGGFTLTGSKAADYQLVAPSDLTANISPKSLSVTGVAATNKVYDATTVDPLSLGSAQLSGVVSSDGSHVTLVSASAAGTFASADVGSNIAVTVSGLSLTGSAAGNYAVTQPSGLTANITQAPLTITLSGNPTKTYNGTTTAVVLGSDLTISGFVGMQSAAVTQYALAEYASPNAGNNIGVTATLEPSDFSAVSGTSLANYSFPRTISGTGTINRVALTGNIGNNPTKTYDGTTAGTVNSADYVLSGFVGSESISVNQTSATYASANAGPETITASLTNANYTAGSGTLLSNYVLPSTLSGSGTIQPQQINVAYTINGAIVNNPTKTYDGTTTATLTPSNFLMTGWVGSDAATVTQTVGQYAGVNVGTQNVTAHLTPGDFTAQGSTNISNYILPTVVYGSGTINPAILIAAITHDPTKVYDGTSTAVLSSGNYSFTGFAPTEGADVDPASLINYASKNVGQQTITAALTSSAYTAHPGTLLSNYVLATSATGTGHITPAPLYVTGVSAADKVYDTTTAATLNVGGAGLAGVVSGDAGAVTLAVSTSGAFSQADVGNGLAVTTSGFSILGSGASNYALQSVTGLHANITPAPLTISGVSANNKVYSATAAATLSTSGATLSGVLGSDSVTLSASGATGTFASVDVGVGLAVTAVGFSLGGGKASDYQLSQPSGLSADITPKLITVTITGNPIKAYDGSNSATLAAGDYTLGGFAGSQNASIPQSATANYLSANAGSNIGLQSTLVISDFVAIPGTNLSNYTLPTTASGTFGQITPKVLNLTGTRVYDTTTNANAGLFGTLSGLNGDTLTVAGSGTLSAKDVGTQNFSSLGSLAISGNGNALASNYTLVGGTDWVKITPATLTVTGTLAGNKIYDGNTNAALSGATLTGVLGSDVVSLGNDTTGAFNDKNVGSGKTVTTAMTIGSTDAGDYTLIQPSNLSANITQLAITVAATGANKVYDANVNDAATLGSSGVLAGDTVTFTDTVATFADKNVGNVKTVSVSGISAGGTDAGNYLLSNTTATTSADITPKVLNLTGARVYDANTDAAAGLFGSSGVLTGVNGETLTLGGGGTLSSKDVNPAQTFSSLAGFTLAGNAGALASNYTLVGGTDSVKITPATLTVTGTIAGNKIYDGNANAALSGATLTGVLGSDVVSLGNDTTGTFNDKNVGSGKTVTTAMTIGSTDAGDYTLIQPGNLSANITQLAITVAATGANKVYDANVNDAATLGSSAVVSGDAISFSATLATFADANVGNAKTVSVSGISASGADAGNYLLSNTAATTTADITPKVLNLTGTRVYDANTDAAAGLFGSSGMLTGVNGETLTLGGSGTLSSKDVNPAQTFSALAGFTLAGNAGALASNYTLVGGTDSVNITKLAITVAATGANKVYDANVNDAATLAGSGVLGSDAVTFTDTSAIFANKNVGNGKTVSVSGISAGGTDAGNYSYNTSATTAANITPLAITVSATGANKVYDANTADAATLATSGVLGSDTVTFTDASATFADKNVGNLKTVSVTGISAGGTDAGNYSYNTTATASADITPKVLNLTGTRVYDANTDAAAGLFGSSGVLTGVNGETLTLGGGGTLSNKDVNPAQTFSSLAGFTLAGNAGALASNYTLAGGTDSVNITKLSITVAATGANKIYDANTADAGATLASSGILAGDTVSFSNTTATFADKNVGNGKTVSVSGISAGGTDAGNYSYNTTATTAANITPLAITVAATGAHKVYDANVNDAATLATSGVLGGDAVTFTDTTATFADKNVGNGKTVSVSGISAGGTDAGNYSYNTTATTAANITPLAITVAATGANKVYDANTADAGATLATSGVLAGDTVSFTHTAATFADKNVGSGKTVSVSGISAGGTDAGNYSYNTTATTAANITPLAITVAATGTNKVYDANVSDAATLATSGVLTGDAVSFTDTAATFADKNVGNRKTVSVSGISAGGTDAGNYSYNTSAATSANITPKAIAVAAIGTNKVYDGNTSDRVALDSSGIVSGDSVTLTSAAANFASFGVGNDKTVTVTGIRAAGSDAGNYTLTGTSATTTADITSGVGIQDTAVAVGYLELSPDAIATPYGVAPSESPGQVTGNVKMLHRPVEPNQQRADFKSGLSLLIIDGGVRMPADAR
jgi:filamentous hemagglutinin family protein